MASGSEFEQHSAGGVVYRLREGQVEVALILVGPKERWQLPKGTAKAAETQEETALREVREETGLVADLQALLDQIDYWFYAAKAGGKARMHKFVTFYLMRYRSGDVSDHDHEVVDARWVEINQAIECLAFESERKIMRKALEKINEIGA